MHDLRKGKAWNPHCRLLRQNYCYSIQLKIERISHSSSSSNIRAKYGSWCQVKERQRPGYVPLISVSTQQEQLRRQHQQQQRYQISNKYMFGTKYRYTLGTFSDHLRGHQTQRESEVCAAVVAAAAKTRKHLAPASSGRDFSVSLTAAARLFDEGCY